MANINYEYAINFEDNEKKYQEAVEVIKEAVLYFTQNTLLQLVRMDLMCDLMDIQVAIDNGERGEFLYSSALAKIGEYKDVKIKYEASEAKGDMEKLASAITKKLVK